MCGRYVSSASTADLMSEFDVEVALDTELQPSWNVAPTDPVRIITERLDRDAGTKPVRQLRTARWGLVPSWSADRKSAARMINARVETVTEKPAFRTAAARRRCLVPALGYYEWQRHEGAKTPYFLRDPAGATLAMAGLYELWPDPNRAEDDPDRWLWTCTIITEQATDLLGVIHDRNPVMVPPQLRSAWLDCSSADAATARGLLEEIPEAHLQPYQVSAAVGKVANNYPGLIDPFQPTQAAQQLFDA